jgi:hypothetical protein
MTSRHRTYQTHFTERLPSNDKDHMRRFLKNLRTWGLVPEVVVTDGSNL